MQGAGWFFYPRLRAEPIRQAKQQMHRLVSYFISGAYTTRSVIITG